MECVAVCDDDALRSVHPDRRVGRAKLRKDWDFWLDLPNTPKKYIRIDDLEEGIGALETILLDKTNYLAFTSGDGACLGCSEKTVDAPLRRHRRGADAAARRAATSRSSTT